VTREIVNSDFDTNLNPVTILNPGLKEKGMQRRQGQGIKDKGQRIKEKVILKGIIIRSPAMLRGVIDSQCWPCHVFRYEILDLRFVIRNQESGTRKQEPGDRRTKPVGQGKRKKAKVILKEIIIHSPGMPRGVNVTNGRVIRWNQGIFNSFNFFIKFEHRYFRLPNSGIPKRLIA